MKTLAMISLLGLACPVLSSCTGSNSTVQRYSSGPTAYEIEQENRYKFEKRESDLSWR